MRNFINRFMALIVVLAVALCFVPTGVSAAGSDTVTLGPELNGSGIDIELNSGDRLNISADTSVYTSVTFNSTKPFTVNGINATKIDDTWYTLHINLWIGKAAKGFNIRNAGDVVWPYLNIYGDNNGKSVTYTACS